MFNQSGLSISSSGSSAASGAMTLISKQVLGAPAATVSFASIPQTYTNLKLMVVAASTSASVDNLAIQFNGDTAAHYMTQFLSGLGTVASASAAGPSASAFLGNLAPTVQTNGPGTADVTILGYTNTAFFKAATGLSVNYTGSAINNINASALWQSTAAITSILLLCNSGSNFATGSVFSLYGVS